MTASNGVRTRLTIDVSPDLKRRIKVAAAQRDVSVKQYVVDILEAAVPREDAPKAPRGRLVTKEVVEAFREIREANMQGRPPFTDDSTDIINEARLERTLELERASGRE